MSGGFCGIDPPALGVLATRLEWAAGRLDSWTGPAYDRLARHSRWACADSVGTRLSTTSRWARTSAIDLRRRAGAMEAAEQLLVGVPRPPTPGGGTFPAIELEDWVRGALGVWNGRADELFPLGRWVFGDLWINRVAQYLRGRNPIVNGTLQVPSIANGWAPRQLAKTGHFRWISNPAVQAAGKRLSFGFAVVSAIGDAKVVWDHGNPVDAFESEGAGYVADLARLGFSGSSAVFLAAPNPIAGGAVIVTGLVWAGAEVVDHWDEITETWNAAYEDFARGAEALYDSVSGSFSAGGEWTSDRWDDVTDWTGDGLEGALDWSNDRLHDATEWTGDRLEDLADVGSGLIDIGVDALDFVGGLFRG